MKTVALLVIYVGYGLVAYGLDHLTNNCTPFSCVMLGKFAGSKCSGTGSVPCQQGTTVTKSQLNSQGQGNTQTVQTAQTPSGPMSFGIGTAS